MSNTKHSKAEKDFLSGAVGTTALSDDDFEALFNDCVKIVGGTEAGTSSRASAGSREPEDLPRKQERHSAESGDYVSAAPVKESAKVRPALRETDDAQSLGNDGYDSSRDEGAGIRSNSAKPRKRGYSAAAREAEEDKRAPKLRDDYAKANRFVNFKLNEDELDKDLYSVAAATGEEDFLYDSEDDYSSGFSTYLQNILISISYKFRRRSARAGSSVEDDSEYLGPESSTDSTSKYYGSFISSTSMRVRFSLAVWVIMLYMTIDLPLPGMLKDYHVASIALLSCQLLVILLCLDVFTNGILSVFSLRFSAEALVSISCLVSSVDAVSVARDTSGVSHLPFCAASSLAIITVLWASSLTCKALRKATRVPSIAKRRYCVTCGAGIGQEETTVLKSRRELDGFVRRSEESPLDEMVYLKASPIILAASFFFAVIASAIGDCGFLHTFSVILAASVPVGALLSFALPYAISSTDLFNYGAAIAGWSGVDDIGGAGNLIITDSDLFPASAISVHTVQKTEDADRNELISIAASIINESGSVLIEPFDNLMTKYGCDYKKVVNFKVIPGGYRAIVDGHSIVLGGIEAMRLLNRVIPAQWNTNTSIMLEVDGNMMGNFLLEYSPLPNVRYALISLMSSGAHPVFAMRDFNITPELITEKYDVPTDGYDFPPYLDRFALTDAGTAEDNCNICACICTEGLRPLAKIAEQGKRLYNGVRLNIVSTLVFAFIGCIMSFFLIVSAGVLVNLKILLVIMLMSILPIAAVALLMLK